MLLYFHKPPTLANLGMKIAPVSPGKREEENNNYTQLNHQLSKFSKSDFSNIANKSIRF